ncbi:MAG: patatin-like phospholipase family protein [Desulfomonilaceae bacterium]|nr:patatin-like phospholipase family protein [Desulfomonilaceae bacterium]
MSKNSQRFTLSEQEAGSGLGLVLSAGGARGAYQLGCWKAFRELGLSFQAVAGSSIGALNGALVCQNDWDKAYRLWIELTRTDLVKPDFRRIGKLAATAAADLGLLLLPVPKFRLLRYAKYAASAVKFLSYQGTLGRLHRDGIFSMDRIRPLIEAYLDMDAVRASSCHVFVTVFGTPDLRRPLGRPLWFRLQECEDDEAWNVLGASMSVPFLFSSVEKDRDRLSDGGVRQWLPIRPLYDSGIRRLIAVSIKSSTRVKAEDFPGCDITLIRPAKPLGRFPAATFNFKEDVVNRWIDQGYEDAMRAAWRLREL